jgi:hypothetical protein
MNSSLCYELVDYAHLFLVCSQSHLIAVRCDFFVAAQQRRREQPHPLYYRLTPLDMSQSRKRLSGYSCDLEHDRIGSIRTSMSSHTLILQPWKPSIVHHCIDLWKHRIHGAHADPAFHLIRCEQYLITYFMPCSTGAFLLDDPAQDVPGLIPDTLIVCHKPYIQDRAL